jgi:hypothetical protein
MNFGSKFVAILVSFLFLLANPMNALAQNEEKTVKGKVEIGTEAGMTWFYVDDVLVGAMGLLGEELERFLDEAFESEKKVKVTGYLTENGGFDSEKPITATYLDSDATQSSSKGVLLVKNGFIPGFETAPIGKVLDSSFDNPSWEEFETDKGEWVVSFTGNISEDLRKSALSRLYDEASKNMAVVMNLNGNSIDYIGGEKKAEELLEGMEGATDKEKLVVLWGKGLPNFWPVGEQATFQWKYNYKSKEFELSYMGADSWSDKYEGILHTIFNY